MIKSKTCSGVRRSYGKTGRSPSGFFKKKKRGGTFIWNKTTYKRFFLRSIKSPISVFLFHPPFHIPVPYSYSNALPAAILSGGDPPPRNQPASSRLPYQGERWLLRRMTDVHGTQWLLPSAVNLAHGSAPSMRWNTLRRLRGLDFRPHVATAAIRRPGLTSAKPATYRDCSLRMCI